MRNCIACGVIARAEAHALIERVGFLDFRHIEFDAEARRFGNGNPSAFDPEGLFGQALAVLPDPVRIDGGDLAGRRGGHVREHGQGNVEVIVGVRAPGQAPLVAQLRHAHGAAHGPEMGIGQGNVHGVQLDGVPQLTPVGGDHVGRGGQAGSAAELGHHFASRKSTFRAAGIFGVREHIAASLTESDGFTERPGAIGVDGDARVGEAFGERDDGFHLFGAVAHAALQLEVAKAVARLGGLGEADDGGDGQCFFVAEAEPIVRRVWRSGIGQSGLRTVAHVEQVPENVHGFALLPFAKQGGDRDVQKLSQQIEQGGFEGGHGMNGSSLIEGLQAAAAGIAAGKAAADGVQNIVVGGDRMADHQRLRIDEGGADGFAAGHFADAGVACAVFEDHQVSRK